MPRQLTMHSTQTAAQVLQVVEVNAIHDAMRLNPSKCAAIVFDGHGAKHDGTCVAQPDSAKHLGCRA